MSCPVTPTPRREIANRTVAATRYTPVAAAPFRRRRAATTAPARAAAAEPNPASVNAGPWPPLSCLAPATASATPALPSTTVAAAAMRPVPGSGRWCATVSGRRSGHPRPMMRVVDASAATSRSSPTRQPIGVRPPPGTALSRRPTAISPTSENATACSSHSQPRRPEPPSARSASAPGRTSATGSPTTARRNPAVPVETTRLSTTRPTTARPAPVDRLVGHGRRRPGVRADAVQGAASSHGTRRLASGVPATVIAAPHVPVDRGLRPRRRQPTRCIRPHGAVRPATVASATDRT